ncbi:MAG: hypothetical protein PHN45_06245, partial [Methylococcales bacterium]|nr:hypothetical protein [Methylococcales bacterium]
MAYPLISNVHLRLKAIARNAATQAAIYQHSTGCGCGCAAPLANNRKVREVFPKNGFKIAADLNPRDFQNSLKKEVNRSLDALESKYAADMDKLASTRREKPSVILDSYVLSSIVAQIEANTDFFPKGTDKALAGNCGKRVMSPKLMEKIYGSAVFNDDGTKKEMVVDIISCEGSVSYANVMCCHNIWGCPICARKISERRKKGLSLLLT